MSELLKFDPLGDGKSKVELIDWYGSDKMFAQMAAISFGKDADEKRYPSLVRRLVSEGHWGPFEHSAITLLVNAPLFVTRQWQRHRIGMSYNEHSRRYSLEDIEFYTPKILRHKDGGITTPWESSVMEVAALQGYELYLSLIDQGIVKEQARMVLPQSMYTSFYVTMNLRSAAHFCELRLDSRAQGEIVVYADCLSSIMLDLFPLAWGEFLDSIERMVR